MPDISSILNLKENTTVEPFFIKALLKTKALQALSASQPHEMMLTQASCVTAAS